jgi:uncharacterized protein (TIGR02594 family)
MTAKLLEVWESRIGIAEVSGKTKNNPIILEWCSSVGWPSITDDETPWCAISMNSACIEAGLPMTPHNARPSARSFLTWGKTVDPMDVQPGDVCVWPRGNSSWQGHVNCVAEVKKLKNTVKVRCIGGNQTLKGTGGAVTKTDWVDIKGTLPNGVRRPVEVTVKDLRAAGSSEIKTADTLRLTSHAGNALMLAGAVGKATYESQVPGPTEIAESATKGFSIINALGEAASGTINLVLSAPWLIPACVLCTAVYFVAKYIERARLKRHLMGQPIAAEVAALQEEPAAA